MNMAHINLEQQQSCDVIQRAAKFLAAISSSNPTLQIVSASQDSGNHFAKALKTAVSALLLVGASTTMAQSATDEINHQAEPPIAQPQIKDLLYPMVNPKYTCQVDEDTIEQLKALNPEPSDTLPLDASDPSTKSFMRISPPNEQSSAFDEIVNTQAFSKLLSHFNPQIEAELRWWCAQHGQSLDFGVAAQIFNPRDWKATAMDWERQIQTSAKNPEQAHVLRQDLIHQTIENAFEQAKTLTYAQIEATGIENPVLASAVLDLQAEPANFYDEDLGRREGILEAVSKGGPNSAAAPRIQVRDSTATAIAAGIAGAALGALVTNALNQRKAPPVIIYQTPSQSGYSPTLPGMQNQAPQTYFYNPSTGSIIGPIQGALQGLAGATGSYVPLTTYTPRPY